MKRGLRLSLAIFAFVLIFMGGRLASHNFSAKAEVVSSGTFGANGDNLTWTLDDQDVLTISGTGEMGSLFSGRPWGIGIKQAIIEDGVTSIGHSAFQACKSLTSMVIPVSVTKIETDAFSLCSSLTSVTIPEGVTSIGVEAFSSCSGLTSLTIPDSVTSIGNWAFSGCGSLTSVTIPDSVTYIGSNAIPTSTTIYTPCAVSPTAVIQYAEDNGINYKLIHDYNNGVCIRCGTVESEEPNIVASGTCGANGDNLTWTLDNQGVLTISGTGKMADYSWTSSRPWGTDVEQVIIENGVTSIGNYAIYKCSNLVNVTFPDSLTSIGSYAFGWCSSLTSLTIPGSVTSIGSYAFGYCRSLTSVTIPESVTSISSGAFSGCSSLTSVTIPEGVTSIGAQAFLGCNSLTSVTIPDSVTSIGNSAFSGCGLTNVTIPDSVTSLAGAFAGCSQLTELIVLNTHPSYTTVNGVLYDKSMSSIICYPGGKPGTTFSIPSGVTNIGDYAFSHCGNLTSMAIPDSVTSIGDSAFSGCSSLTSVTIPESVTSIGDSAFFGCSSLTSVTIPDGVTSISSNVFCDCSNLTSVTIPDGVTSIGSNAFAGCSNLTSVTIPDSVTSIDSGAFQNCRGLISVTIPASVGSIGGYAFQGSRNLSNVTILNPNAEIVGDNDYYYVFRNCAANLTLYGLSGSTTETYAANWGLAFVSIAPADFVLPAGLTIIEEDAFQGISAVAVQIPAGVTSIAGNPFADSTVRYIYGVPGTAAQTFADTYGYTFVPTAN